MTSTRYPVCWETISYAHPSEQRFYDFITLLRPYPAKHNLFAFFNVLAFGSIIISLIITKGVPDAALGGENATKMTHVLLLCTLIYNNSSFILQALTEELKLTFHLRQSPP